MKTKKITKNYKLFTVFNDQQTYSNFSRDKRMRFNVIPSILLFLGSYFPLTIILMLQDIEDTYWSTTSCTVGDIRKYEFHCSLPTLQHPAICASIITITLISLILLYVYLKKVTPRSIVVIEEIKSVPNDLVNYVFPYVVSFMGITLGDTGKLMGALLFLCFMFILTYRSGEVVMNPILLIFGWRIYEVKGIVDGQPKSFKAISKDRLYPKDKVGSRLAQDIYILIQNH